MTDTVYTRGMPGEMSDIIDFINYVFSQAHQPHDFKTLLPKVYGDDAKAGQESFHFLAKQNGKIVACVADRPTTLRFGSRLLNCGYVGSVSVHPYHRSEGHMKRLMSDMIKDAREKNYDMLILGGQRQRYGHFGFDQGGIKLGYTVIDANVRHALKDIDAGDIGLRPLTEEDIGFAYGLYNAQIAGCLRDRDCFMRELRSWSARPMLITLGGESAGYIAGAELLLKDESILPKVVKKLMEDKKQMYFRMPLYDKNRISFLSGIAEHVALEYMELINVLNWKKVLSDLLAFKAEYVSAVEDGEVCLDIEGENVFTLTVKGGVVSAADGGANPVKLTHNGAVRAFFSVGEMFTGNTDIPSSWRGIPFFMSEQDCF